MWVGDGSGIRKIFYLIENLDHLISILFGGLVFGNDVESSNVQMSAQLINHTQHHMSVEAQQSNQQDMEHQLIMGSDQKGKIINEIMSMQFGWKKGKEKRTGSRRRSVDPRKEGQRRTWKC